MLTESWPPTEADREEAQGRDAAFRLRLWTWVVRKHGRAALLAKRPVGYVVMCLRCRRLVTMPRRLGPAEHQRMRLHLNLHGRFFTPSEEDLLRHFAVSRRR